MKTIISLCFLFIHCASIHAQVITIKDQENYQPLERVTLSSESPKASAITNSKGQADLKAFRGAAKIEIRIIGYKTLVVSFAALDKINYTVYMSPTSITLDQVVVAATRWDQPQREVPVKISTITPKEVALQNPLTTADLLGLSGEVFIQKSQLGGGSPMIRGFATNRLLITVDGVRMNTAIFRSGNLQNVISLDPFDIEKTEVLFGPGSVIYGSDAIGGVMSFYTLRPRFSSSKEPYVSGSALCRYSSACDEFSGHFDINMGIQKWAMLTSVSHFNFGDLRMGSNGPDDYMRPFYVQRQDSNDVVLNNNDPLVQKPTAYSQVNMMQKIRFSPNEKWDVNYGFHYSETSDLHRYDRLIRLKNGLPISAEWYYGPQIWMMNNLSIRYKAERPLYDQFSIRLAQQVFKESRVDRDYNKIERRSRTEEVFAYSANLDLTKTIENRHELFYGFEAVFDNVSSSGTDEDIAAGSIKRGPARYPQSTWASYAAYLSLKLKATEKLIIQAGTRFNQYKLDAEFDTTFYPFPFTTAGIEKGAITGSAGLTWKVNDNWSMHTNLSTGFRAPNVDDMGKVFDSEPGAVVVPNPGLESEYAYNAEAGILKLFDELAKLEVTAYYTRLENAMVRRDFTLNGMDSIIYNGEMSKVQAIQNAAFATVYGIQLYLEVSLPAGFGLSLHFNYQKGEEELDDGSTSPLRHAPPWYGTTHFNYSTQKLRFDIYAVYNGLVNYTELAQEEQSKDYLYAADKNGNPYSPAWATLNFKLMYQLTDNFSVSTGVENILDKRYRPYSSGISAPGRNFLLSLKAKF